MGCIQHFLFHRLGLDGGPAGASNRIACGIINFQKKNCFSSMDIQLIIVFIIGIAVAVKLGYEIYKFFFVKKDSPYCNGCTMCKIPDTKTKA